MQTTGRRFCDGFSEPPIEKGTIEVLRQEAKNRPNIDWQEQIHRGILRGLRNISETP